MRLLVVLQRSGRLAITKCTVSACKQIHPKFDPLLLLPKHKATAHILSIHQHDPAEPRLRPLPPLPARETQSIHTFSCVTSSNARSSCTDRWLSSALLPCCSCILAFCTLRASGAMPTALKADTCTTTASQHAFITCVRLHRAYLPVPSRQRVLRRTIGLLEQLSAPLRQPKRETGRPSPRGLHHIH